MARSTGEWWVWPPVLLSSQDICPLDQSLRRYHLTTVRGMTLVRGEGILMSSQLQCRRISTSKCLKCRYGKNLIMLVGLMYRGSWPAHTCLFQ